MKLPKFFGWLEYNEEDSRESSFIIIDERGSRMASPFQSWLTKETMSNSASSIRSCRQALASVLMSSYLMFHTISSEVWEKEVVIVPDLD